MGIDAHTYANMCVFIYLKSFLNHLFVFSLDEVCQNIKKSLDLKYTEHEFFFELWNKSFVFLFLIFYSFRLPVLNY